LYLAFRNRYLDLIASYDKQCFVLLNGRINLLVICVCVVFSW